MTYQNKLVAVVKCNEFIMRERDDTVFLPFGSEYSLLIKNLDSRRVRVNVSIDSTDVLSGQSLIINGNSETELKGFLDGNTAKNRFKFIQKTEQIVRHRGDKIDDSMIRIEFTYEKRVEETVDIHHTHIYHDAYRPYLYRTSPYPYIPCSGIKYGSSFVSDYTSPLFSTCDSDNTTFALTNSVNNSVPAEDEGLTVRGSEISQDFSSAYIGDLESSSHVIIIKLSGSDSKNVSISKPVTVKTKLVCSICGTSCKSNNKFCSNCGTFLM